MLSDDICNDIFQQIDYYKNTNKLLKVIYLGDILQINPVNNSRKGCDYIKVTEKGVIL